MRVLSLPAAPEPPALPWLALTGAAILVKLGWGRPRRAIALAVALLLPVLAFEDGLRSVHHLVGQTDVAHCAIAAATALLTATTVDCVTARGVICPLIAARPESVHANPVARFLSPDQGLAPPPTT